MALSRMNVTLPIERINLIVFNHRGSLPVRASSHNKAYMQSVIRFPNVLPYLSQFLLQYKVFTGGGLTFSAKDSCPTEVL